MYFGIPASVWSVKVQKFWTTWRLESQGVTILACTTCLEYFDLVEKVAVGKPTTMVKSIEAMYNGNIVPL